MKKAIILFVCISFSILFCSRISAQSIKPASPPPGFENKYATVNGVKIHYVTGGKGGIVIDSWLWSKLIYVE